MNDKEKLYHAIELLRVIYKLVSDYGINSMWARTNIRTRIEQSKLLDNEV